MTPDERAYYAAHSPVSDPGELAPWLDAMPTDPGGLVGAVSGLVLRPLFVAALGLAPHPDSADDTGCGTMRNILGRILARDGAPLDVRRPPGSRFVGICRDYALVACAAFRHRGIPARLRVGFATYFAPGVHDDHWVCEYHAEDGWRLLDPQLSEPVRRHFAIAFPPSDVSRDAFVTAGETWRRIRRGRLDPATCGVWSVRHTGEWFVAASVVRDLATLNKREVLAWDCWGISRAISRPGTPVPAAAAARIDALAEVVAGPHLDWKTLRETYEGDTALTVPPVVLSCGKDGPVEVAVPA